MTEHLSEYLVDRFVASSVSDSERQRVEAHRESCQACAERLHGAEAARAAFLQHNPPALRVEAMRPRPARWRWAWTLIPVAAVVLVLVLPRAPEPDVLFKGGPSLSFRVQRATGGPPVAGVSGMHLSAGDAVALQVDNTGYEHVTTYTLTNGTLHEVDVLHHSLVQDGTPERTWLIAVFSHQPIGLRAVESATRQFDGSATIPGAVVRAVLLEAEKRSPTQTSPDVSRP